MRYFIFRLLIITIIIVGCFSTLLIAQGITINNIPNQVITKGEQFQDIILDSFVEEISIDEFSQLNKDSQLKWTVIGTDNIVITISNRIASFLIVDSEWVGIDTVWFIVTNVYNNSDTDAVVLTVMNPVTSVTEGAYNYPNPFSPNLENTHIVFELDKEVNSVTLEISNMSGKLVVREKLPSSYNRVGVHDYVWSGKGVNGITLENGIYIGLLITELGEKLFKIVIVH